MDESRWRARKLRHDSALKQPRGEGFARFAPAWSPGRLCDGEAAPAGRMQQLVEDGRAFDLAGQARPRHGEEESLQVIGLRLDGGKRLAFRFDALDGHA